MWKAGKGGMRLQSALVIGRWECSAQMRGIGPYVTLALALAATAVAMIPTVRAVRNGELLVSTDPLGQSAVAGLLVLAIAWALSTVVSVARERESGVLELVFYGPIDEIAYIVGKVAGIVVSYAAMAALLTIGVGLLGALAGFPLSVRLPVAIALSVLPMTYLAAIAVLIALTLNRVRGALVTFVLVLGGLAAVVAAYRMTILIPIDDPASPLLAIRGVLAALTSVTQWVSPVAFLEEAIAGLQSGSWGRSVGASATGGGAALVAGGLAVLALRRRGVARGTW
jgi:ABC-type multidrug transport system permease subunit